MCPLRVPPPLKAGGWGKKSKDYSAAELSGKDSTIPSRPVEDYELQQPRDFLRKVMEDKEKLRRRKERDFIDIARQAGVLEDQKGDGVKAMGAFDGDEDEPLLDEVDVR